MIAQTKNQEAIAPFFSQSTVVVPSSVSDGSPYNGTFMQLKDRTNSVPHMDYQITTDATAYTNLSPDDLDLFAWPLVQRKVGFTNNVGEVLLTKNNVSLIKSFNVGDQGISSVTQVGNTVLSGTVLEHCHDLLMATASAVGKDDYYFRTISGATPAALTGANHLLVEPNPNCWAASWDFSGVPIWNSFTSSQARNGVLITPRHLLEVQHYKRPVGTVFKFMDANGDVFSATSIGVCSIPTMATNDLQTQVASFVGDVHIHTLSAALPETVKYYPVIGAWGQVTGLDGAGTVVYDWLTNVTIRNPISCIYLNQNRSAKFLGSYGNDCKTTAYELTNVPYGGGTYSLPYDTCALGWNYGAVEDAANATGRHASGVTGDSGSALFVPLSTSDLAIAFCFTSPVSGSSLNENRINALIAAADADANVSTGLTVTVAPDPTL